MLVILAFGGILSAGGLLLLRKYAPAGRAKPVGTFLVTPQALLYYLGVIATVLGALFLLLAASLALG